MNLKVPERCEIQVPINDRRVQVLIVVVVVQVVVRAFIVEVVVVVVDIVIIDFVISMGKCRAPGDHLAFTVSSDGCLLGPAVPSIALGASSRVYNTAILSGNLGFSVRIFSLALSLISF